MSPEQASGGEIDARSDQFSLGAVLYQLATGALPFSGTTPLVTMAKIVKGDHAPPSAKNPRLPPYLERVIERLLKGAPGERFPSVDACAEALRDGLVADGFADVDAELAAYLRDPAGYNAAAERRIVDAALAQAETARARGETARALAAAGRALAWRPDEPRALALTAGLATRSRRVALAVAAGALVVAGAGALGWRALRVKELAPSPIAHSSPSPAAATPIAAAVSPPTPTAAPATSAASSTSSPPPARAELKKVAHHAAAASATPTSTPASTAPATTAAATAAPARPVAGTVAASAPVAPARPAADAPATLAVAIAPWCDLTVDGNARGRSPTTLTLPPGPHHLVCANPVSGRRLTRDLALAPGERRELREQLYADGARPAAPRARRRLRHRRRQARVRLPPTSSPAAAASRCYKAGAEVETRWLDVPPAGCTLVDAPALACEKP